MDLNLDKIKKVYLAGIGGIGLSALAYYFHNLGKEVFGSDLKESEVTKRLLVKGLLINFKQKAANLTSDIDLFIYSSALAANHAELVKAQELQIPIFSYFQFLGYLSRQYETIAVCGTNGKTTTTAMLGLILEKAGLDPTVIVGSLVPQWNANFRLGQSKLLVVEACEWQAHMLEIFPKVIVLTNIAADHLDYYKNLRDIQKHFQKFVNKLPKGGLLIKNGDDKNSRTITTPRRHWTFGQNNTNDFYFDEPVIKDSRQHFNIYRKNKKISPLDLSVPGKYNIYNALAAIATAIHYKVNKHQLWNALHEFKSSWRRFEIVGEYRSNLVISDYAHHPDSILGLLRATKDFYPDRKIIAIFQPHHHNRTRTLLREFAQSFYLADQVIISEIYSVSGREGEIRENISSRDLVKLMNHNKKYYAADLPEVKSILKKINPQNAVLLFIGAGDIDEVARSLIR